MSGPRGQTGLHASFNALCVCVHWGTFYSFLIVCECAAGHVFCKYRFWKNSFWVVSGHSRLISVILYPLSFSSGCTEHTDPDVSQSRPADKSSGSWRAVFRHIFGCVEETHFFHSNNLVLGDTSDWYESYSPCLTTSKWAKILWACSLFLNLQYDVIRWPGKEH